MELPPGREVSTPTHLLSSAQLFGSLLRLGSLLLSTRSSSDADQTHADADSVETRSESRHSFSYDYVNRLGKIISLWPSRCRIVILAPAQICSLLKVGSIAWNN